MSSRSSFESVCKRKALKGGHERGSESAREVPISCRLAIGLLPALITQLCKCNVVVLMMLFIDSGGFLLSLWSAVVPASMLEWTLC